MVEVIKGFYKLSDKKTYKVGDKVDFGKDNARLIKEGLVKKEVVKKGKK